MDSNLILVLAAALFVAGGAFLYLLFGRGKERRPKDAVEWTGAFLSALLVLSAVYLVTLVYSDGTPTKGGPVDPQGYPLLTEAEMGAPAPDFSFRLVDDGTTRTLSDYRGKVVLINFWATWCAPCLQELPDLNALQERYGDDGLVVLTLSDETPEELRAFEESMVALETVSGYVDAQQLPMPYGRTIRTRPTSYIIDREGRIREYILGARDLETFTRLTAPYLQPSTASL